MENGQFEAQSDRHLQCLAKLPISFLSERSDQISGICDLAIIDGEYRELFVSSVWVYPLHAYISLLREQMGDELAEAVWSYQRAMFDEIDAGTSQSMESAFLLIDSALEVNRSRSDKPVVADRGLPETRVAMALLLGMPESPDYTCDMDERSATVGKLRTEVEACLARCLLWAREELIAACSELFPRTPIDR